jgi:hypothetical protein
VGSLPLFEKVPEDYRQEAVAMVPWQTEPEIYRGDLANRLPDGLRIPRCFGVFDIDDQSAAVWMKDVPTLDVDWDLARHERAAYLLGRMAASRQVP